MNGVLGALLDGQSCDFKSTSRLPCLRTRRNLADTLKAPQVRAANRRRRSFPIRTSFDDANGISQEEQVDFRQEMVNFAKTAQTMMDQRPFHDAVAPEARSAMKYIISDMLGSVSHQFFDIRYSAMTKQFETLVLSMQISGYMIKNAQDRMNLTSRLDLTHADGTDAIETYEPLATDIYEPHARTHDVKGDVIRWEKDSGPESIAASKYIKMLEAKILELEEREQRRFKYGEAHRLVDYMKALDDERLQELSSGASNEVLLSMHLCAEEFLGKEDPETGPMNCSLPKREMFRLMEWLMIFGYNLRCKEITYEMEQAFDKALKAP